MKRMVSDRPAPSQPADGQASPDPDPEDEIDLERVIHDADYRRSIIERLARETPDIECLARQTPERVVFQN